MRSFATMLAASVLTAAAAQAQFVDNGGSAGTADTTALGQPTVFENATTTFDGVEFRLLRLIRDPSETNAYRMIAEIANTGSDEKEILFLAPLPELLDELGNAYGADMRTGIEACRNGSQWSNWPGHCDNGSNAANFSRLSPGVPLTTMLRFVPGDLFEAELADLATKARLRLHFVVAEPGLETMNAHEVVIANVPLPR